MLRARDAVQHVAGCFAGTSYGPVMGGALVSVIADGQEVAAAGGIGGGCCCCARVRMRVLARRICDGRSGGDGAGETGGGGGWRT